MKFLSLYDFLEKYLVIFRFVMHGVVMNLFTYLSCGIPILKRERSRKRLSSSLILTIIMIKQ